MKIQEKLEYIQKNHFEEWIKMREEVENKISASQGVICVCGKLATGFHEMHCSKLQDKITEETLKKLEYLILFSV